MGDHVQGSFQFSLAQNLETVAQIPDHTAIQQKLRSYRFLAVKLLKVPKVDHGVVFLENIRKSALGQAPVQWHLAALESGAHPHPRPGPLPLTSPRGSLAVPGSHSLADSLGALVSAARRP